MLGKTFRLKKKKKKKASEQAKQFSTPSSLLPPPSSLLSPPSVPALAPSPPSFTLLSPWTEDWHSVEDTPGWRLKEVELMCELKRDRKSVV